MTVVHLTPLRRKIMMFVLTEGITSPTRIGEVFSPNPTLETRTRWAEGTMKPLAAVGWVIGRRPARLGLGYVVTDSGRVALGHAK